MGVDMYLWKSKNQASSTSIALQNQNQAYQSLQKALNDFSSNSGDLSGLAYDSAKVYCSQILIPLTKACILLNEEIEKATLSLPDKFISEVDSVSLREDELRQKIAQAHKSIVYYQKLRNMEYRVEQPDYFFINSLTEHIAIQQKVKQKLEDKLQKILTFHNSSSGLFSNIDGLYQVVRQGLSQAKSSWNEETKTFVIPPQEELMWVKQVHESWGRRLDKEKLKSGEGLTIEDIEALLTYARSHPEELVSPELIQQLKSALELVRENYDKNGTQFDLLATIIDQLGIGVQRFGGLATILEGIKGPSTFALNGVSTSFVLVKQTGIGQALVQKGTNIENWGKWGGRSLMGIGFGLGMDYDIVNTDKSIGQAVVHNGLSTGIGFGAAELTTVALGAFLGSNPVGWAAVGVATASFAIGVGVTWLFNKAYENNFLGLKDGLDTTGVFLDDVGKNVGQAISNSVESAKNWASEMVSDVGNAISGGLSALNPFD